MTSERTNTDSAESVRQVLVTRAPGRSAALIDRLRRRGIEPVLSPLSEARAVSGPEADQALEALDDGPYDVVTFTSTNGVRGATALLESREKGPLAEALAPATVWCVGPATLKAASAAGLSPVDQPPENSARAMVAAWADVMGAGTEQRVLCVHGRPARSELVDGLREKGHEVHEAVVYESVPYPADRPLDDSSRQAVPDVAVLDRDATRQYLSSGGGPTLSGVVATSPRRIETLVSLGPVRVPVVCIGTTTERAARSLGLETVLSAGTGPEDLARAVAGALDGDEEFPMR